MQKLAKVTEVMVISFYRRYQVNISKYYIPLQSCTIEFIDFQVNEELLHQLKIKRLLTQ